MRRHLIMVAYALVLIAAILALRQTWHDRYQTTLMAAREQIGESIEQVESLIQTSIGHVNMLRISADDSLSDIKEGAITVSPLYRHVRQAPEIGGYCSEPSEHVHARPEVSLSGLGALPAAGTRAAHEINMALLLNPQFAATAENIPNLAWAYYTSARRFIVMYPFIACRNFHFSDDLLAHEFYTLGTPARNPSRSVFWTEAYMDEAGKGLMATVGAPVYDGSRFLGTVAIDLTLEVLSDYVRNVGDGQGSPFIVNDQGQVLAHPALVDRSETAARRVEEIFGAKSTDPMKMLRDDPEDEFVDHEGMLVYSKKLRGAPWRYVYLSDRADISWRAFLDSRIEAVGVLLLALLIAAFERSRRVGRKLKHNVRELKRMQSNLQEERDRAARAEQAAHQANMAKSVMLANASHDLRTPLNAIIGFSELVLSRPYGPIGSPKYEEYLRDIHASGSLLLAIVNDVLDLSKIEAGRFEMKESAIDVAELIETSMSMVSPQAARSEVEVQSDLPADLPALWADPRAMQQVLLNLLSNAIKFTPAGGHVVVRARRNDGGGLTIDVADTGTGITPQDLSMLFTPFSRGASADTAKTQGTGLGLTIVKSLVEMHGGTVGIESLPGTGSTVTLTLPADRLRSFRGVADATMRQIVKVQLL